MDGSLDSIFMHPPLHNSINNGSSIESAVELKYKLLRTSIELEKIKAEEKLQETKLWRLQELLSITQKERDEAREECRKLQECLLLQPSTNSSSDSPTSFIHSASMVSSPSSSPWSSLQELEDHLNSDSFTPASSAKIPTPLEVQQALQAFSQTYKEDQDLHALFSSESGMKETGEEEVEQFDFEILDFPTDLPQPQPQPQKVVENPKQVAMVSATATPTRTPAPTPAQSQSVRSLSRQSSANSSSASVQMYQQGKIQLDTLENTSPTVTSKNTAISPLKQISPASSSGVVQSSTTTSARPVVPTSSMGTVLPQPSPLMVARQQPMILPIPAPMQTPSATTASIAAPLRKIHLPEPPEADPQVVLNSLPEKGKLLQAVMQAGPLLQTLLLAGPLPQWRHPPPALSSRDIPQVSLMPSNVLLPYSSQVSASLLQAPPMGSYSPINNLSRVRVASYDPCSRSNKLRRLSPDTAEHSQLMHMLPSGGARLGDGVSHSSSIY